MSENDLFFSNCYLLGPSPGPKPEQNKYKPKAQRNNGPQKANTQRAEAHKIHSGPNGPHYSTRTVRPKTRRKEIGLNHVSSS